MKGTQKNGNRPQATTPKDDTPPGFYRFKGQVLRDPNYRPNNWEDSIPTMIKGSSQNEFTPYGRR